jgi:hypothetical protein
MWAQKVELAACEPVDHVLNVFGMTKVIRFQTEHFLDDLGVGGQQHLCAQGLIEPNQAPAWKRRKHSSNVIPGIVWKKLFPVPAPQRSPLN